MRDDFLDIAPNIVALFDNKTINAVALAYLYTGREGAQLLALQFVKRFFEEAPYFGYPAMDEYDDLAPVDANE